VVRRHGNAFQPQVHYFVGGSTKLYGAALYRLREEDFGVLEHEDGVSPAWPIAYAELEPYYTRAEQLYRVHGARGEDPTEPPASAPYRSRRSATSRASSSCPTTSPRRATTRSTRPAA
jgi:choline dehydrogenase-like flavoprotein